LAEEGDILIVLFGKFWDLMQKVADIGTLEKQLLIIHELKASVRNAFRHVIKDARLMVNLFEDVDWEAVEGAKKHAQIHFEAFERFEIILAEKRVSGEIRDDMVEQLEYLMRDQHQKFVELVEAFLINYCDYEIRN
jgi:hypothetical protein